MEARTLRFARRRWEERFCVLGEVFCAVGGIEAFGEDDDFGASARGFEDFGAGMGEVVGFVGGAGQLDEGEFDGLFEELGHGGGWNW